MYWSVASSLFFFFFFAISLILEICKATQKCFTEPETHLPLHLGACMCACVCMFMLSCFSHVQLCDPMDCSPPDSSVHGILQARILEWVTMPSSRGSLPPGIEPMSVMSPALQAILYC